MSFILEIDPTIIRGSFYNALSTMCVWNLLEFDNAHVGEESDGFIKQWYPHLEYLILMTFTGGRDYNNWYREDKNGDPSYDFNTPIEVLKNIIRGGVKPFIVIGQMTFDLSTNPDDKGDPSTLWGNRYPPKDWDKYYSYIKAFAKAILNEFGIDEVKKWKFRLMTEWDDFNDVQFWWKGTKEEYLKLYDYTEAALSSEIGEENLFYGPGNLRTFDYADLILEHCAYGVNHYTGRIGTKCDHISMSAYFVSTNVEEIPAFLQKMWSKARQYPSLNIREVGFGETGFFDDGDGKRLQMAQGITEEYGSAVARIFDLANVDNLGYCANWEYLSDRCNLDIDMYKKPFLETPASNAAKCVAKLLSCSKIHAGLCGSSLEDNKIGAQASFDSLNGKIYVLVYNHNSNRGNFESEYVNVEIRKIESISGNSVRVRHWRIDRDTSNFANLWLKESENIIRKEVQFDMETCGNSKYDVAIQLYLDTDDKEYYYSRKLHYDCIGRLSTCDADSNHMIINDSISMLIKMPCHSVSLLEISNITESRLYVSGSTKQLHTQLSVATGQGRVI